MTTKILLALQHYEGLAESGAIPLFVVHVQEEGVTIEPMSTAVQGQHVPLLKELQNALHSYFYGNESIPYGSFDYASLKGFLTAGRKSSRSL